MAAVPPPEPRGPYTWVIPADPAGGRRVPGILYSSPSLFDAASDGAWMQLANVTTLPGIVGAAYAMPDIHYGYGFPVGGVAAFDRRDGVVSPGGIGYDINCGVRLLRSRVRVEELRPRLASLLDRLFRAVPSGVGARTPPLGEKVPIDAALAEGARAAVAAGLGDEADLAVTEEGGHLASAAPAEVSELARQRGRRQLGTLGSGNHFLEIQAVDAIANADAAAAFGLVPGTVAVMLHTGSRGLGHQVATDSIARMDARALEQGTPLVDRQLACAPVTSEEAQQYLGAMAAAANFAWANRQAITAAVRDAFAAELGASPEDLGLETVYDLSHNMAKSERHRVDGEWRELIVHRKGATRAFPAGREEIPARYRAVGQPVLIPGDMGTASYVLRGLPTSLERSFGSSCHGAGRRLSRHAAARAYRFQEVQRALADRGIQVRSASRDGVVEEAPGAYKDVEEVVRVAEGAGLTERVARLVPLGVVKG